MAVGRRRRYSPARRSRRCWCWRWISSNPTKWRLRRSREFFGAQPMIPGWGLHHTEAFSRFKRAGMALEKFRAYEIALRGRGIRHSDDIEDLGFYADAFYYFAWRFVRLVRLAK